MQHRKKILVVKKKHCIKNIVISTTRRCIVFLSPTYSGSVHDKAIADEQNIQFRKIIDLLQDTGFQGYAPKNANIIQPIKKPKGKELTDEQKTQNTEKSKKRVYVEHAIRGFKIWRIAKDICRTWVHDTRDDYIFITCGLHNFRLKCRTKANN